MVVLSLLFRSAQPRTTEEQSRQIFEKGSRIEQEFAEYFTGEGGVDYEDLIQILLANLCSPYPLTVTASYTCVLARSPKTFAS